MKNKIKKVVVVLTIMGVLAVGFVVTTQVIDPPTGTIFQLSK